MRTVWHVAASAVLYFSRMDAPRIGEAQENFTAPVRGSMLFGNVEMGLDLIKRQSLECICIFEQNQYNMENQDEKAKIEEYIQASHLLSLGRQKVIMHMLSELLAEKKGMSAEEVYKHYDELARKEAEIVLEQIRTTK